MRTKYLKRKAFKRELNELWLMATNKYMLLFIATLFSMIYLESFR